MSVSKQLGVNSAVAELASPMSSSDLHFKYSDAESPSEKSSPQSLYAKPWPSRPQLLAKASGTYKWWHSAVDVAMVLIPVPFFLLGIAVVAVSGREVNNQQLTMLDRSIKGVLGL